MTSILPKLALAACVVAIAAFAASAPAQDTALHGDAPASGHHATGHAKGGWTHTPSGHSNGHAKGGHGDHGDGHGSNHGDGHSDGHAQGGHADASGAAS